MRKTFPPSRGVGSMCNAVSCAGMGFACAGRDTRRMTGQASRTRSMAVPAIEFDTPRLASPIPFVSSWLWKTCSSCRRSSFSRTWQNAASMRLVNRAWRAGRNHRPESWAASAECVLRFAYRITLPCVDGCSSWIHGGSWRSTRRSSDPSTRSAAGSKSSASSCVIRWRVMKCRRLTLSVTRQCQSSMMLCMRKHYRAAVTTT